MSETPTGTGGWRKPAMLGLILLPVFAVAGLLWSGLKDHEATPKWHPQPEAGSAVVTNAAATNTAPVIILPSGQRLPKP